MISDNDALAMGTSEIGSTRQCWKQEALDRGQSVEVMGEHTFYMMEIPPGDPVAAAAAAVEVEVVGLDLLMRVRCVHYYSMPSSA